MHDDAKDLKHLGSQGTAYPSTGPHSGMLETFPNPAADDGDGVQTPYEINHAFKEFSSLCLAGETLVDVATDETAHPEGVMIKDLVGTEGVVFSFDPETNRPVAKRYHSVRKTIKNAPVVLVTYSLMKGPPSARRLVEKRIRCTDTHPFLVRVGFRGFRWVPACDLTPNDRLVADQRHGDKVREVPRHRLVMEAVTGVELEDKELIHHVDHNHGNNTPSNLEVTTSSPHFSHHQTSRYGYGELLDVPDLVARYGEGASVKQIADAIGCDSGTIKDRLVKAGVVLRTQRESMLAKPDSLALRTVMLECRALYEKGYTTYELGTYYKVHPVTITNWVRVSGGAVRKSSETQVLRNSGEALPALNHRVVSVRPYGTADVYNMEVEGTECFFANGVVVHNCPKTGQPDFASVYVSYVPGSRCVETKSLKLYYFAFRNEGCFMERIANQVKEDLVDAMDPVYLEVGFDFAARGGIATSVRATHGTNPFAGDV